jgi:hypothetical protein
LRSNRRKNGDQQREDGPAQNVFDIHEVALLSFFANCILGF